METGRFIAILLVVLLCNSCCGDEAREELLRTRDKLTDLEHRFESCKEELMEYQALDGTRDMSYEHLHKHWTVCIQNLEEYRKRQAEYEEQVTKLETDLNAAKELYVQRESEMADRIKSLEGDGTICAVDESAAEEKYEKEFQKLRLGKEKAEANSAELFEKLQELMQAHSRLNNMYKQEEDKAFDHGQENLKLKTKMAEMEKMVTNQGADSTTPENENSSGQGDEDFTQLKAELKNLKNENENLREKNEKLEKKTNDLHYKLSDCETLRGNIRDCTEELKKVKHEQERRDGIMEKCGKSNNDCVQSKALLLYEKKTWDSDREELENKVKQLEKQLQKIEEDKAAKNGEAEAPAKFADAPSDFPAAGDMNVMRHIAKEMQDCKISREGVVSELKELQVEHAALKKECDEKIKSDKEVAPPSGGGGAQIEKGQGDIIKLIADQLMECRILTNELQTGSEKIKEEKNELEEGRKKMESDLEELKKKLEEEKLKSPEIKIDQSQISGIKEIADNLMSCRREVEKLKGESGKGNSVEKERLELEKKKMAGELQECQSTVEAKENEFRIKYNEKIRDMRDKLGNELVSEKMKRSQITAKLEEELRGCREKTEAQGFESQKEGNAEDPVEARPTPEFYREETEGSAAAFRGHDAAQQRPENGRDEELVEGCAHKLKQAELELRELRVAGEESTEELMMCRGQVAECVPERDQLKMMNAGYKMLMDQTEPKNKKEISDLKGDLKNCDKNLQRTTDDATKYMRLFGACVAVLTAVVVTSGVQYGIKMYERSVEGAREAKRREREERKRAKKAGRRG